MRKLEYLSIGCVDFPENFNAAILPANLRRINLQHAKLTQFPEFVRYTPNIEEISVAKNSIAEISSKHLSGLSALKDIKLEENELSTIPDLYYLPLTDLTLSKNPLVCNQSLCWIRMWPWAKVTSLNTDDITCEIVDAEQSVLLTNVNPITLGCHYGVYIPLVSDLWNDMLY